MKIKKLFSAIEGIEIRGSKEVEVKGLCSHSQRVAPGDLFIALKGKLFDGTQFIPEAMLAGAVAVLTDIYNPFYQNIVQIVAKDVKAVELEIAKRFYQDPSKDLTMIGVTGTNGKTTTTYLIHHILRQIAPAGLMGTVEMIIDQQQRKSEFTTPQTIELNRTLKEMVARGCKWCVMEASSHALDQNRIANLKFDRVVFTNLSEEHLDYHQTMENYLAAKQKLFSQSMKKEGCVAILNEDANVKITSDEPLIYYGLESEVRATDCLLYKDHMRLTLHYYHETIELSVPLVGFFNVYNVLAASAVCLSLGVHLNELKEHLATFEGVPGRMEKIDGRDIFVDFAHTPDALHCVLSALRPLYQGRIIVVFGAGGGRDPSKRKKMGACVDQLADVAIITSDNPRNEDPQTIAGMVAEGMQGEYEIELDRYRAIEKAIAMQQEGDVVLIAGKGHEARQILRYRTIEFDDAKVVREILA